MKRTFKIKIDIELLGFSFIRVWQIWEVQVSMMENNSFHVFDFFETSAFLPKILVDFNLHFQFSKMFKPVVGNEAPWLRAAKLSKAERKLNIFLDNWTEIIQTESFSFKINIFCLSPNVSSSKNGFQRSIVLTSFLWWKVLSFISRGVKHTRSRSFLMFKYLSERLERPI